MSKSIGLDIADLTNHLGELRTNIGALKMGLSVDTTAETLRKGEAISRELQDVSMQFQSIYQRLFHEFLGVLDEAKVVTSS